MEGPQLSALPLLVGEPETRGSAAGGYGSRVAGLCQAPHQDAVAGVLWE